MQDVKQQQDGTRGTSPPVETRLSDEQVADLLAKAGKATPGPVTVEQVVSDAELDLILDYQIPGREFPILIASTYGDDEDGRDPDVRRGVANAVYLAAAYNAAPELCREVRRLREAVAEAVAWLEAAGFSSNPMAYIEVVDQVERHLRAVLQGKKEGAT
jgi:hypothetical protein